MDVYNALLPQYDPFYGRQADYMAPKFPKREQFDRLDGDELAERLD